MSLRRKDDWDEALEEANRNSIKPEPIVYNTVEEYGRCIKISYDDIRIGEVLLIAALSNTVNLT